MKSTKPTVVSVSELPSPVGTLRIGSLQDVIITIAFDSKENQDDMEAYLIRYCPRLEIVPDQGFHEKIHRELMRYFEGTGKKFTVKTHLFGTEFQLQVWTALRTISYGTTSSYKAISEMIGNPNATRAVGGAVGRNPIPIVIPCHRIIGENGSMVGFGGGIDRKRKLLRLEGSLLM
jgi:methylated-DNA-[protein]-cysteine S-methyltransferase